jgi:hypothetical protein
MILCLAGVDAAVASLESVGVVASSLLRAKLNPIVLGYTLDHGDNGGVPTVPSPSIFEVLSVLSNVVSIIV